MGSGLSPATDMLSGPDTPLSKGVAECEDI